MVSIQDIRAQLTGVKRLGPGLVAVFVGGTSGIGETTAREFVRYTINPRVYLVGRSQEQADHIQAEFKELNPESQVNFIQSDVSLLQNVDKVCDEIKAKEEKINVLFLSAGIMTMKGRDETAEGLDKKLSLHYYSRLRFTQNFLPLLNRAATPSAEQATPISRVVSVLGAGLEDTIDTSDLSLKSNYSVRNAARYAITMTTLSFQNVSQSNPGITFIHSQPGGVHTNLVRDMGKWTQFAIKKISLLAKPWLVPVLDSGERHTWTVTNEKFGKGGTVLVGQDSEITGKGNEALLKNMSSDGTEKKVWEHTEEVFEKVCRDGGKF